MKMPFINDKPIRLIELFGGIGSLKELVRCRGQNCSRFTTSAAENSFNTKRISIYQKRHLPNYLKRIEKQSFCNFDLK